MRLAIPSTTVLLVASLAHAGAGKPVIIPAENHKGFLLVSLETGKEGETLRLVVDTGAEVTAVDETHPCVKRAGRGAQVTSQGRAWGRRLYLSRLKAGEHVWNRPRVVASKFAHLRKGTGIALDGVLGADLLSRHVVVLDYDAGQVRLLRSFGFKPDPQDKLIPAKFDRLRPVVTVLLGREGKREARALFDTGASGVSLLAYPDLVKALESGPTGPERGGLNISGGIRYAWGRPEYLTLGPFKIKAHTARSRTPPPPKAAWNAILGSKVTSLFTVTVDHPRRKLYLRAGIRLRAWYERARGEGERGSSGPGKPVPAKP
jgi:hypothetical protein